MGFVYFWGVEISWFSKQRILGKVGDQWRDSLRGIYLCAHRNKTLWLRNAPLIANLALRLLGYLWHCQIPSCKPTTVHTAIYTHMHTYLDATHTHFKHALIHSLHQACSMHIQILHRDLLFINSPYTVYPATIHKGP